MSHRKCEYPCTQQYRQLANTVLLSGINHTPFHDHQEHDTSLKAYAIPVVHLLATVLRKGFDTFSLPSSPHLDDSLLDFEIDSTVDTLHAIFLALWMEVWPADMESHFSDPTICFLAIFTLKKDGHFQHPKKVTGILAKLCRAIRLTVLAEVHARFQSKRATSLLEAFHSVAWAVQEGNTSTFHKLMFYQHYASAISMQTISLPKIVWPFKDEGRFDTMLFEGQLASLKQFLEIIVDLELEAIDLWENKILRGAVLYAPHHVLADNLRNNTQGYSMFREAVNGFINMRHELGTYLLQLTGDKGSFTQEIPGTRQRSLKIPEVRIWLQDLARLEGILQLLVEMKSGSPIRLAELCATLSHNTEYRLRNLMAFGKRIMLIRQYTKTTSNRQMDSLIPSLLAALDADLWIQVQTFARPVAQVSVIHDRVNIDTELCLYCSVVCLAAVSRGSSPRPNVSRHAVHGLPQAIHCGESEQHDGGGLRKTSGVENEDKGISSDDHWLPQQAQYRGVRLGH